MDVKKLEKRASVEWKPQERGWQFSTIYMRIWAAWASVLYREVGTRRLCKCS